MFQTFETLSPIYDHDRYSAYVARQASDRIFDLLYRPLLDLLEGRLKTMKNSKVDLVKAIREGRIQYKHGIFVGNFSASISSYFHKWGIKYDKYAKGYRVAWAVLQDDVKESIKFSEESRRLLDEKVMKHLDDLSEIPSVRLDVDEHVGAVVSDLEKQFQRSARDRMVIQTEMTPDLKRRLAEEYINNTETYIKGWTDEAVGRLRQKVTELAQEGVRAETLAKTIMAEAGVTRTRADFIARQEMSLTVSKFRQERYEAEGLDSYRWSTSHDRRVRHDHKALQGRVFCYAEPPIVDAATGRRANPGEDFNCRCVAIPILSRRSKQIKMEVL